ncbi:AarF/ABC1/UbiB kinase family protein [Acetobacteraceae bacterium H6797]|nr:AarF/ABC1/UbiB kinase family protein [Acetobacteraceae bacterium H6797]
MADDRADGKGSTIFGEIRRMARTSGAVGGIAARMAGERFLGIKTDRSAHANDLAAILGGLKGPLMKVAQILSTIPDALPEEYAQQMATLQANAPPMGWAFVRRRMSSELGPAWQSKFAEFGQEAAAAASLGQVHKARLHDGQSVACKLQYPDMPSVVEADLRQLKMAMAVYHRIDPAIRQDEVYEELSERLREELDYEREAAHARLYGLMLRDVPGVRVPMPIEELTTTRLLTMDWLDGMAIQKRLEENPSEEERAAYGTALFRAWYRPFYRYGVIHGDPHLGNYQVRPHEDPAQSGINLLDFGAVRIFPPSFVRATLMLYEAVRDEDEDKMVEAFGIWGFRDISIETMRVLSLWAKFLYGPLMQDRVRPIQEDDDPSFGRKVAAEVHAGLKRTGGVRPPREFVLMDRAAVGLGSVFLRLRCSLNWHRLFEELTSDFNEAELAARQAAALEECRVPRAASAG